MRPEPPRPNIPPIATTPNTGVPKAMVWYKVLLAVLIVFQGVFIAGGYLLIRNAQWFNEQDPTVSPDAMRNYGMTLIVTGAIFALLNIALYFLPRRSWAYGLHLTNVIAGITLCCPAPLAIWVLILMLKPECRQWFDA